MKVGDLVIVNVPAWCKPSSNQTESVHGLVVDRPDLGPMWLIMRSDTGKVEEFHEDWMKAGENGSW